MSENINYSDLYAIDSQLQFGSRSRGCPVARIIINSCSGSFDCQNCAFPPVVVFTAAADKIWANSEEKN